MNVCTPNLRTFAGVLFAMTIGIAFDSATACQADMEKDTNKPIDAIEVSFVKDVKPVFETNCISCHGPNKEEEFRIDDRDATMEYVEVGKSLNSDLYARLVSDDKDEKMPPPDSDNPPLSESEVKIIRDWIDQGADWPDGVTFTVPLADVAAPAPMGERIWSALGLLHPAAVHLPIGLLLAAGLFSLLGMRGNFVMSDSAYYCLWLGTLSAIVATAFGWSQSTNKGAPGDLSVLFDQNAKYFLHRVSGVATTVFALLLSLYAARARALDPDDGFLWKLGAILLACGIGYCGYEGGKITHGEGHYRPIYSIIEDLTGWDVDGVPNETPANTAPTDTVPANDEPKVDAKPEVKESDKFEKVGETSTESSTKPAEQKSKTDEGP